MPSVNISIVGYFFFGRAQVIITAVWHASLLVILVTQKLVQNRIGKMKNSDDF
jgi:hypothetical protein